MEDNKEKRKEAILILLDFIMQEELTADGEVRRLMDCVSIVETISSQLNVEFNIGLPCKVNPKKISRAINQIVEENEG